MNSKILKHGTPARLFPIFPESAKEKRTLSVVLATMVSVQPFSKAIFNQIGVRFGKRTSLSCFTEVTLTNEIKGSKDRPDALIVIENGKNSWSALVEAKIGTQKLETDQIDRYIELARANSVDAIISITNELTPDPTINPTRITKNLPKNLSLFHFSWSSLLTSAFLLATAKEDPFNNDDEAFLISELIRYLETPNSGRLPLDQMNKDWPKIVTDVQSGHPLNPKSLEIAEMITMWHQESRDVALIMTRKLQTPVSVAISRKNIKDRTSWIDHNIKDFCTDKTLNFDLDIPNAASKISVEADFRRRTIRTYMKLAAPSDKKSNSAKLNWLLRQLNDSDLSKIIITCITIGRSHNFGAMAHEIDPSSDDIKELNEIVSFQIEMSLDLGKHFNSRKKFIESLEAHIPSFYKNVGQKLKEYVPSPPKLKKSQTVDSTSDTLPSASDELETTSTSISEDITRPDWTTTWQNPISNWPL